MKSSDIFLSFIIILLFISIYIFNIFSIGLSNIKKNWPVYRCNPSVMPFAGYFGHDPASNFAYCIQNMQTSYMGFLLKPTHYVISLLHSMVGGLITDVNWVRKKIDSLVSNLTTIITSIFSVFINIMIEFQRIIIKLKDTVSKVLGIMVSIIYLIEGGMLTGTSVMAGPVGETLRFVCFHPDTKVVLRGGTRKKMSDVVVDDVLVNGSKVMATMKIKGNEEVYDPENCYYAIYSRLINANIYVTGSHLIHDKYLNKYIHVRDYSQAIKCPMMRTQYMSCLITDDHLIQLGEHTFWDWED
jgi:hypothetical protein